MNNLECENEKQHEKQARESIPREHLEAKLAAIFKSCKLY